MSDHVLTAIRVVLLLSGLSLLGMAYWVRTSEDGTATRSFVVLLAVVGLMAIADAVAAPNTTRLALVWALAYMLIPVAFGAFVVEYYGLPYLVTRSQRLAFLAPVAVGVAGSAFIVLSPSMTAPSVMAGGTTASGASMPAVVTGAASMADSMGIYYAGGVMMVAMGVLLRTCRRYTHLNTRLAVALSFVGLWPWLSYLTTPVTFELFALPTVLGGTAAGYALSALAAGFVVSTGRLFEATPAAGTLGPETVLADLADPVLVVDRDDRIVRLNEQAATAFGTTVDAAAGEPFASVVGVDLDVFDGQSCVELTAGGRTRYFEGTVADVRDRHGRTPGRAIVVRDVTQRRLRGQRLTVLNRVLRHNLRNQMTSIIGRAELLADGGAREGEVAEAILTTADDLVTLGERAREVEKMMSVTPSPDTESSVSMVVRTVVEDARERFPHAEIATDVAADLTVPVDERILAPVLDHLVENAIEHNDSETPRVTVSARESADQSGVACLTVTDNGPGIPDTERAVIDDGEESPLEHGSGLGLWAVYWGVTRMGGSLSFDEGPDLGLTESDSRIDDTQRGTRVTVRIPSETGAVGVGELTTATVGAD